MPYTVNPFTGELDYYASGDADLSGVLLLAGRTGTANDATLSTDAEGTFRGSGVSGGAFHLGSDSGTPGVHIRRNAFGFDRLLVGPEYDPTTAFGAPGIMQLLVAGDAPAGTLFGAYFAGDDPDGSVNFFGMRSRGTLAAPTETQDGDLLFKIGGFGYDADDAFAAGQGGAATIGLYQDGAAGSGILPAKISFGTVDASGAAAERLVIRNDGRVGIDKAAPETLLHLGSTHGLRRAITFDEDDTTPADPTDGTQMRVYMKADKFVIQYNDGGTTRYKFLDLTSTGVTWTQTTVAP